MDIRGGFAGKGASNESGVVVNDDFRFDDFRFFRSLYLPNLHIQDHNNYIVLCSPLVAPYLTPNQMTLNDLEWPFCYNSQRARRKMTESLPNFHTMVPR